MNHHRIVAAVGALAFLPTSIMITASSARAATSGEAAMHGCPGGDVCLYNSKAHYNNNTPDVIDSAGGVFLAATNVLIAVNNTATAYSSEGFVESHFKNGMLFECDYVADMSDIQAPDTTENPADDASIAAIARGPLVFVKGSLLPLADCES